MNARGSGGFHRPGQPQAGAPRWVGGRELDHMRVKERAKSAGESEGDPHPLEGMLGAYLQRSSLGAALLPVTPRFLQAWERAAGEAFARRARPVHIDAGVLELEIPDPAWKFELRFREAELVQALRREGIQVKGVRAR